MADKWAYKERWEQQEKLGSGGQADISKVVRRDETREEAVVKTLKSPKSDYTRARFAREVYSLEQVHRLGGNVPRIIEENIRKGEQSGDNLYLIEELIPGDTLEGRIEKGGTLSVDEALSVALSLCKTMELAHSISVLHRDLKPDNLILRGGALDDVVVIDFGLSCNDDDSRNTVTEVGKPFRNPFLALPEHNTDDGDKRHTSSDVTCVAAILHYCLTGQRPGHLHDQEGNPPHRRTKGLLDHIDDSRRLDLESLFDRAFQTSIALRFSTMKQLSEALRRISLGSAAPPMEISQFANQIAAQIRSKNRGAKLEAMKRSAAVYQQICLNSINVVAGKLADAHEFVLLSQRSSVPDESAKIGEWEVLSMAPVFAILSSTITEASCLACYAFIADESRCCLVHNSLFFLRKNEHYSISHEERSKHVQIDKNSLNKFWFTKELNWVEVACLTPAIDHTKFGEQFSRNVEEWVRHSILNIAELT